MILCVQIEKLSSYLSTLSPLIDKYQRGEAEFSDNALKWLEEAEKTMSMLRLTEGAEMSALRGRIIKATDALGTTGESPKRSMIRKACNASAAEALERAEHVMRHRVLAAEERLRHFEDKLCEGMTAYLLENPLPGKPYDTRLLNQVYAHLREQKSTRPLMLYMDASLSHFDRSFILNRVLSRAAKQELEQIEQTSEDLEAK